jgi:threonine dehydrogenase-like Zn-dependent dehydrogenase
LDFNSNVGTWRCKVHSNNHISSFFNMMKRKVLCFDGKGALSVQEDSIAEPGGGELVLETKASLISPGTELGIVQRRRATPLDPDPGPRGFGYQAAGVVKAVGPDCEGFKPGDRICTLGGGYAQHSTYSVAPKNLSFRIPEGVSFEEAAFSNLLGTAMQAIRRMQTEIGEYVGIVGMGLVGQLCAQIAKLCGCKVIAMDFVPMRLDLAKKLGAHAAVNPKDVPDMSAEIIKLTKGHGLDAAIMAFGGDGTRAFKMLISLMKKAPDTHQMGRIVIVGGCTVTTAFADATGNVDVRSSARTGPGYHDKKWERGQDYPPVFVPWDTKRNLDLALELIEEGRLQVKPFITDRVTLDQAPAACEKLITNPDQSLGVVVEY